MLNKIITLLLLSASISSCAYNKKSNLTPQEAPKVISESPKDDSIKMFSVSDEEIKKSGNVPTVIYFDTNSAKLNSEAKNILGEKVLAEAKNSKTKRVVIEAHCDERGSESYNQKLSEKRAKSVKKYLVKNGVANVKIKTIGYGESKPVALGHDEDSWSKNRRAVTISIKK